MAQNQEPKEMPFLAHVDELRKHLIRIIIAIVLGAVIASVFFKFFIKIINGPLQKDFITYIWLNDFGNYLGLGEIFPNLNEIQLNAFKVTEDFSSFLVAVIVIGLILSLPYIVFELMRFILPALTPKERKYSFAAFFSTLFFFLLGIFFAYYFIVPFSVRFFYNFNPFEVEKVWTIGSYITTSIQTVLGLGIVFLMPVIVYFLSAVGILTPKFMKTYRRHAFLVVLVVAGMITPSDWMSMFVAAIPLWILYELSILVSSFVYKRQVSNL